MSNTVRTIVIVMCAALGALMTVTFLPPVLDNLYNNLRQIEEQSNTPNTTVADVTNRANNQNAPEPPTANDQEQTTGEETSETTTEGQTGDPNEQVQGTSEDPATPGEEGTEEQTEEPKTPGKSSIVLSDDVDPGPQEAPINRPALALLGAILGAAIGSLLLRKFDDVGSKWEKMAPGDKVTVFVGSILGFFAGIIISLPFQVAFQGKAEGAVISIGLIVGCSALSVYILRTMSDVLPWETTVQAKKRTGIKVFDTNVLIDGRIYDLVRTGFVDGEIYVPKFVLLELQHIADSADSLRRQRGRRGLDVLKRIQAEFDVTVGDHDKYAGSEKEEVDDRLVKLAKAIGGDLVSNDYNLNKVATIQDVRVLNINELALALRPTILPGEPVEVTVVKEGNQYGQGVGYLDDGTMVVVEHGHHLIGETVSVPVSQVIQTERGKMLFADASELELSEPEAQPEPQPKRRGLRRQK